MVPDESSLRSLPFPFCLPLLPWHSVGSASPQSVLRCGALCLALNDQRRLCSQAWGQWLGGSVARTLWLLRKHMRLCLRRPGPVSQSPSLLPFLLHRWVPLGLLLSSAKDTAVTREGAGGRKGEGPG